MPNLLYVRAAAGATTGDNAFIGYFTGAGWTVVQRGDDELLPDMSAYDVVFISGASASASVAAKYRTVTKGVVVSNNGSWDDMDLAIGSATIAAITQITVYAGHPIAAGYSGTTTIFTSAAQMRWASPVGVTQTNGTLVGSRLNTVGEGMLWAYESGATMENSYVAPARRVGIGFHADTMTVLNTAGQEILLAAVEWAANLAVPAVSSVTVAPLTATIATASTVQLTETVSATGGASTAVTWSTNNAPVATVNASGLVTAVSTGVATITATSDFDNTKSGSATITVDNSVINVLFVRGAAALNTSENQIISRLEGQGRTVTVTTDTLLSTAMANGYDLVMMSKTVISGTVGTKLKTSTTPVMFWEDNQQAGTTDGPVGVIYLATIQDNLTTNTAWHNPTTVVHVDAAVPAELRAGLSGVVTIYSSSQSLTFAPKGDDNVTETLIAGATRVGEYANDGNGRWSIYVVEAGTTLQDATTAPARRGYFGVYDDTFQYLTADGLALWDAQVDWLLEGAGTSPFTLTPDAHVSVSGIVDQSAGTTNLHLSVDDPVATTDNDTTYLVNTGSTTGTVVLGLSNTPGDFGEATEITLNIRLRLE